MLPDQETQEFRPEQISRRGEWLAWAAAALVGATWFLLVRSGQGNQLMIPLLEIPLLVTAISISLGNWVDRKTVLHLDHEGVAFQNGLRRVRLAWDQIRQVQVLPSTWGQKVWVLADQAHFSFRTLGEIRFQGEVKGRVGFVEGERILKQIIAKAQLQVVEPETTRAAKGDYYARA